METPEIPINNFTLKINNKDFPVTSKVLSRGFSIRRTLSDYNMKLTMKLTKEENKQIETEMEIALYEGTELLFAGLIERKEIESIYKDFIIVKIECVPFTKLTEKRTVTDIIQENVIAGGTADVIIKQYITSILSEEGVTEGRIKKGGLLIEEDYEEFVVRSIRDIFDDMAGITDFEWLIGMDKKVYFGEPQFVSKNHTLQNEILITENGAKLIECREDSLNYKNKIFVHGGVPYEDVPEEFLDIDGNIKYVLENVEEQNYLSTLTGRRGVYGYVERDTGVHTIEDANKIATELLNTYGERGIELKVTTDKNIYKEGSFVWVEFLNGGIDMRKMLIEEIEINYIQTRGLIYTLNLVTRKEVGKQQENLQKFMKKIAKREIPKVKQQGEEGEVVSIPKGVGFWADFQDTTKVDLVDDKIMAVRDKVSDESIMTQIDPIYRPSITYSGGHFWMDFIPEFIGDTFDSGKVINYNKTYEGKTIFMVYISREPHGSSYNTPLGFGTGTSNVYARTIVPDNTRYGDFYLDGININKSTAPIYDQVKIMAVEGLENKNGAQLVKLDGLGGNKDIPPGRSDYWNGAYAEIIVYEKKLSVKEIEQVNNYLIGKYL